MLWAASLLWFYGFLRSGEITIQASKSYDASVHLNYADVRFDNPSHPSMMQVHIKASKTDPFWMGCHIYVAALMETFALAINAMLSCLAVRGSSTGLLFHFKDTTPLVKSKFVSEFRDKLSQAGLNSSEYSGHSFRIGAASTAAANGVEDSLIQILGRWKRSAYLLYVRIAPQNLAAISKRLNS